MIATVKSHSQDGAGRLLSTRSTSAIRAIMQEGRFEYLMDLNFLNQSSKEYLAHPRVQRKFEHEK